MRWILMACAGILLSAYPSELSAQQPMRGDLAATTDSLLDVYAARLNLTDEQQAGVREILLTQGQKARDMIEAARAGGRDAMMEMRPKLGEVQIETNEQVEALLTGEQIPEYQKIQAEIQAQRQNRRERRQPGG